MRSVCVGCSDVIVLACFLCVREICCDNLPGPFLSQVYPVLCNLIFVIGGACIVEGGASWMGFF